MQVATSQQHDQTLPRCHPKPPQALTTHVTQLATVQTSKRPPHNVQRSQAHRFAAGRCGSASDAVRPIAVRAAVPAAAGQLPWRHAASLAAGACGALGRAARGRTRGRCAVPRHAARRQKGVRGAVCVWVGVGRGAIELHAAQTRSPVDASLRGVLAHSLSPQPVQLASKRSS